MNIATKILGLFVGAIIAPAAPTAVQAQDYPTRSITVVVPFPAGGPSDVIARIVTEHMSKTLGQSMVIENVGAAGGTIGSARVAAAAPDGYTLLAGSMGSHVGGPGAHPRHQIRLARFRADRADRAFAGGHRRPEGFSGQGPARVRRLSQAQRQRREAGPWRHRRVVAHGLSAVHVRDRRERRRWSPIAAASWA